jgi:DNA-binding MarR family transcriptional regulator
VDELDNLMQSVAPAPVASGGIAKVRYTHDGMIDLIITNPGISQGQLAAHFGYSQSWISQIISSDAFQSRLAERKEELVDPTIRATIEEQFKGLVARSLEILREKLNRPAASIPDNLALRTLELSARAAGYGARDMVPPVPTQEMHLHLNVLGERLTELLRAKKVEAIEGELDATSQG